MPLTRRVSKVTCVFPDAGIEAHESFNSPRDDRDSNVTAEAGLRPRAFRVSTRKIKRALFNVFEGEEEKREKQRTSFIGGFVTPGPKERGYSINKKANLGTMLGVYLPTVQHILGVTMFIRLFWIVGIAGVNHTMLILFCCCLCTVLTSISLSAVATNGVVESGGAYFMISRNLGAEFGSAVGLLFYFANTVAASMYLVGGVEVMLLYIFPSLTIGGPEVHSETGMWGMMSHNYRIYGTVFLIIEMVIVAMGVQFVQFFAPVSLVCVFISLLACFIGGAAKAITNNGQQVCFMGDHLLQSKAFFPHDGDLARLCDYCAKFSNNRQVCSYTCDFFTNATKSLCVNGFPGINLKTFEENLYPMYMKAGESHSTNKIINANIEVTQDVPTTFFVLMAIYFPAVTGIMTGTNMSGDLKNPHKSIPAGTIAATLTTTLIYYALALLFGASVNGAVLRDKYGRSLNSSMIAALLSWPSSWVVIIGSFLSTFGAALQCLCSAPRLLQSIAKDDVIPFLRPFARVTKHNEPLLGLLVTVSIAEIAILLGAVDAIAEVLDFFFLMCYAFVNFICALHSLLGAPNWRPRFHYYHWFFAFTGCALCFFVMFASQWQYAILSILMTYGIYKYVEWKGAKKEWGDGFLGLALSTAQYSLMKLEEKHPHPKNWRPQFLIPVDCNLPKDLFSLRFVNLLNLAGQLKAGKGLAIVAGFFYGSMENKIHKRRAEQIKIHIRKQMNTARLPGFANVLLYDRNLIEGFFSGLLQSIGIGALKPNTVMLNWPHDDEDHFSFATKIRSAIVNNNCIMVAKGITVFPTLSDRIVGNIDVWWMLQDGGILVLTAYLLKQNKVWRRCKIRIFAIANETEKAEQVASTLQKIVYMLRIQAQTVDLRQCGLTSDMIQDADCSEKTSLEEQIHITVLRLFLYWNLLGAVCSLTELSQKTVDILNICGSCEGIVEIKDEIAADSESPVDDPINAKPLPVSVLRRRHTDERYTLSKLQTALLLNQAILENSYDTKLVILTLPRISRIEDSTVSEYMGYTNALTQDVPRVLLIRGTGQPVITICS